MTETVQKHWLNRRRVTSYPRVFVAGYVVLGLFWVLTSDGLVDRAGGVVGYDFLAFWSASSLVQRGDAVAVYDPDRIGEVQRGITADDTKLLPWFYPPPALFVVWPLAALPYLPAYLLWSLGTLLLLTVAIHRIAPFRETPWLLLAYPVTLINFANGQVGFLVTALFALGMLELDRRPILAGIAIGLVSIKPHLGVLIPVALVAGQHWRAFASAAATTIVLAVASTLSFGWDVWTAFLYSMDWARTLLESGHVILGRMPTLFAAAKLVGTPPPWPMLIYALGAIPAVVAVAWIWRRRPPLALRAAVLGAATPLAVPFLYDYDLMLLAVPAAFLCWDGLQRGWLSGERSGLMTAGLLPIAATATGVLLAIQPGAAAGILLLILAVRRARRFGGRDLSFALDEAGSTSAGVRGSQI